MRTILGAYLFKGKDGAKRVDDLSGGEKARLVLAELLQSRPNFLILDEPTNHMDIQAKETLESAFQAYEGTILFVSHDRYFIRQIARSVLIFENNALFIILLDMSIIWSGRKKKLPESLWRPVSKQRNRH